MEKSVNTAANHIRRPQLRISVSKSEFLKEAVLAACCELASGETSFLLRKGVDEKFIDVFATLRQSNIGAGQDEVILKAAAQEFKERLCEKQVQIVVIKNNMKKCEEIVSNALSNPMLFKANEQEDALPESIFRILNEGSGEKEESYLDDVLNIAVPWGEKGG